MQQNFNLIRLQSHAKIKYIYLIWEIAMSKAITDKNELMEACFETYGRRRSSGSVLNAYLDHLGYPTIGCGHLILKKGMKPEEIANYRRRHVSRMSEIGINPSQAGAEYDALAKALSSGHIETKWIDGVNVITKPKMTSLNSRQAEQLFARDQQRAYNDAIRYFPDLHTYPIEVQTCLVHCASHGCPSKDLYNKCKGDLSVENIVSNMTTIRANAPESFSSNTACELYAACAAVGVNPPQKVTQILAKHPHEYASYQKNILSPVQTRWGSANLSNDEAYAAAATTDESLIKEAMEHDKTKAEELTRRMEDVLNFAAVQYEGNESEQVTRGPEFTGMLLAKSRSGRDNS